MDIRLHSHRLLLRTLDRQHAETLGSYLWRNQAFFQPWMPTWAVDALEPHQLERTLQEQWWEMSQKRLLRFFVFHQSDKAFQYILADISYSNIIMGPFRSCFVGYKADARVNNQGIMTEALRLSNQFLFQQWDLHRIEANIMPHNLASQRVVEKLGFRQEGLAKDFLKINGQWEDHYRYALLQAPSGGRPTAD